MPTLPSWLATSLLAALAFLLVLAGIHLARWWDSLERRRRAGVATEGEAEAEAILREQGYTVVGRQVGASFALEVDGRSLPVGVRADLVVQRGRQRFVAEVKTGGTAPDPCHPATRRQLLEYTLVFGADQVLLVDVPMRAVHVVAFPALLLPASTRS